MVAKRVPATGAAKPSARATPKRGLSEKAPKSKKPPRSAPSTGRSSTSIRTVQVAKRTSAPKSRLGLRSIGRSKSDSPAPGSARPAPGSARPKGAPRRHRVPLVAAAVLALVLLATSFPLAGLLSQRHQLAAAAAQLNQLQRTNRSLAEVQRQLTSPTAIQHLARERYQLVSPGQTLYDVLPPGGHVGAKTPGSATSGDPGNQPLVPPADAPDLSPDPNLSATQSTVGTNSATATQGSTGSTSAGPRRAAGPTTFWSRVTDTLEFWR